MTDYYELAELADKILALADENYEYLSEVLDDLDEGLRNEMLDSDFLNAYQVFYFFFRQKPEEIVEDRLLLASASELKKGLLIYEYSLLEIYFRVEDNKGIIIVSDGDRELKRFYGKSAYWNAMEYARTNTD
ncbi:hypothetical protein [Methanoplanus limicola]|jgi:hypothetical protein|uniref:Uncharacterized protein n=1 Tax=Methanoplanus limicola DSM 2279 TaxID=937775 RepID=H1YXR3_9EURY|nr:hypothetical protein [Methanoplanus limicola]EHQ35912.1 hypothetical protein Metlim_1811 [Methanoplanus limicola DSM 2279]